MRRSLLDVNVLLALFDSDHVDHERSRTWLREEIGAGWASCPITQNGFVRIVSQPRYPSPVPVAQAVRLLSEACARSEHEYWPCDLSLLDGSAIDPTRLHGPRQVADAYLLALAASRRARFVTFDSSIPLSAVPMATSENLLCL